MTAVCSISEKKYPNVRFIQCLHGVCMHCSRMFSKKKTEKKINKKNTKLLFGKISTGGENLNKLNDHLRYEETYTSALLVLAQNPHSECCWLCACIAHA